MLLPTKRTTRVTSYRAPCRRATNLGADRQQLYDFFSMDEYRRATWTTSLNAVEETKSIFPLVGQLAPDNSWQGCFSLLHPPDINMTLYHLGY
ncbi:hypothetical protein Hanom_Chr00s100019g01803331 [Helianthus anomalus]